MSDTQVQLLRECADVMCNARRGQDVAAAYLGLADKTRHGLVKDFREIFAWIVARGLRSDNRGLLAAYASHLDEGVDPERLAERVDQLLQSPTLSVGPLADPDVFDFLVEARAALGNRTPKPLPARGPLNLADLADHIAAAKVSDDARRRLAGELYRRPGEPTRAAAELCRHHAWLEPALSRLLGSVRPEPATGKVKRWVQIGAVGLVTGAVLAMFIMAVVIAGCTPPPPPPPPPAKGDGFVDEVLGYFDSGAGPGPGPHGRNAGGQHPQPVSATVVLGPLPPSPRTQWNRETRWLALPTGSYVILAFRDEVVKDQPGPDLIIHTLDPDDSAGEKADVYVSEDGMKFMHLGRVTQGGAISLDVARIGFTGAVRVVKVVGLDNSGTSPGFDLVGVQAVVPGGSPGSPR